MHIDVLIVVGQLLGFDLLEIDAISELGGGAHNYVRQNALS